MKVNNFLLREKTCKLVATNMGNLTINITYSGLKPVQSVAPNIVDVLFSFSISINSNGVLGCSMFLQYQGQIILEQGENIDVYSKMIIVFMRPFIYQQLNAMLAEMSYPSITFENFERLKITTV